MANRARNTPGTTQETVEESKSLQGLEVFYEKNKKRINTISTVVLVLVAGYLGYTRLYIGPREEKAATAMHFPQTYFAVDSTDKALNGDGQHIGFLKIMSKYSGTKQANLCHYYAGVCYLKKGEFAKAVKELGDFSGKGTMLEYNAYGVMGDAYMEMGNTEKGIEAYNKATGKNDELLAPMYLLRAGLAYETINKTEEAKKAYQRIRDEYPQSSQAREVEKTLARLGVLD